MGTVLPLPLICAAMQELIVRPSTPSYWISELFQLGSRSPLPSPEANALPPSVTVKLVENAQLIMAFSMLVLGVFPLRQLCHAVLSVQPLLVTVPAAQKG